MSYLTEKEYIKRDCVLKLEDVAMAIYRHGVKDEIVTQEGIYEGRSGLLLFLCFFGAYTKEKRFHEIIEGFAENIFTKLLKKMDDYTFHKGMSGILYLFYFLKEREMIHIDITPLEKLYDEFLYDKMKEEMKSGNYNVMSGALGPALYFLKKGDIKTTQEAIGLLESISEPGADNTVRWKSSPEKEGYNIALADGMSGIIIFLSRYVKTLGAKDENAKQLLEKAINYIHSQEIDFKKHGCCFPAESLDNLTDKDLIQTSPFSWCCGDPGVGSALWQSGRILRKKILKQKAIDILSKTQTRKHEENNIKDSSIYNGSAGISMVYHRLYLETKMNSYKETYEYWTWVSLQQCLQQILDENGLVNYHTYMKGNFTYNYGLLTGIAGIGLNFLANILGKQDWDELFLISYKQFKE